MAKKIRLPPGWEGKREITEETRKEAKLFAMLYYHFAKAIVDEMGEERGLQFIRNVMKGFATERGEDMKKAAVATNLPIALETMADDRVIDLPKYTFPPRGHSGDVFCPYAEYWRSRGEEAMKLGVNGYCDVVDPWKARAFVGPSYRIWKYGKNLNYGHEYCGEPIMIEEEEQ